MMTKFDIFGRPISSGFLTSAAAPAGNNNATAYTKEISTLTYGTVGIEIGKLKSKSTIILGNYANSTTNVSENYSFDTYGRITLMTGNNHLSTGTGSQLSYFTYDFMDNILRDSTRQVTPSATHTHVTKMNYDYLGRLLNTSHRIMTGTTDYGLKHIATNAYNYRGELITKRVGMGTYTGVPAGTSYLQKTDYTYNEMGWLTKINDPFNTGAFDPLNADHADAFRLNLNYNTSPTLVTGQSPVNDQSGNISQMTWQNRNMDVQGYNFNYDFLSRIETAKYFEVIGAATTGTYNAKYDENLSYDIRGNILTLTRNTQNGTANTNIDNLNYSYLSNTNKINTITDGTANVSGFNQNGSAVGYTYDDSGNTRTNPYKKITESKYYFNNLPKDITVNLGVGNENKLRFTYDASGRKLTKKVLNNANAITYQQDYFGKIEYTGTTPVVEAIYHPEGRAVWTGTTWRYEYNITDHLGNVRAVISDLNNNKILDITTSATTNEIINVNSYYPFGMLMAGTYSNNTTTPDTRYQYNGKEYNSDLGLNLSDYGARWYDAAVGRFTGVDPLAEKAPGWNPYRYGYNNPLIYTDPTGMSENKIVPADQGAADLYKRVYDKASPADKETYDRLEKSDVVYNIKCNESETHNGSTEYGSNQGENFEVDINISLNGSDISQVNALGDELEQARQFEDGEIALVKLADGSSVGGVSYDISDEIKSKDAGLRATQSMYEVKANASGSNAERWLDAKNSKNESGYIINLYPIINPNSNVGGTADAKLVDNYKNVSAVAFRIEGQTIHKKKN